LNTDRPALLDHDAGGEAVDERDIALRQRRAQVSIGRRPAPATPDRLLHRAEALLPLTVVVVGQLEPRLRARLDKAVIERIAPRPAGDMHWPFCAAPVGTAAVPALHADEIGRDIGPAPAIGAH